MSRREFDAEWKRKIAFLHRPIFPHLTGDLSPIRESFTPVTPTEDIEDDSPLPELIVENIRKRPHDESEQFYEKFTKKIRRFYKERYLGQEVDTNSVSSFDESLIGPFEESFVDHGSFNIPVDGESVNMSADDPLIDTSRNESVEEDENRGNEEEDNDVVNAVLRSDASVFEGLDTSIGRSVRNSDSTLVQEPSPQRVTNEDCTDHGGSESEFRFSLDSTDISMTHTDCPEENVFSSSNEHDRVLDSIIEVRTTSSIDEESRSLTVTAQIHEEPMRANEHDRVLDSIIEVRTMSSIDMDTVEAQIHQEPMRAAFRDVTAENFERELENFEMQLERYVTETNKGIDEGSDVHKESGERESSNHADDADERHQEMDLMSSTSDKRGDGDKVEEDAMIKKVSRVGQKESCKSSGGQPDLSYREDGEQTSEGIASDVDSHDFTAGHGNPTDHTTVSTVRHFDTTLQDPTSHKIEHHTTRQRPISHETEHLTGNSFFERDPLDIEDFERTLRSLYSIPKHYRKSFKDFNVQTDDNVQTLNVQVQTENEHKDVASQATQTDGIETVDTGVQTDTVNVQNVHVQTEMTNLVNEETQTEGAQTNETSGFIFVSIVVSN